MKPNLLLTLGSLALIGLAGCATERSAWQGIEQDPAETRRVQAVLDRWIETEGGAERIGRVRAIETRQILEYASGGATIILTRHKWKIADGRYRIETESPQGGMTVEAYDGHAAWRRNERLGFGLASAPELERTLAGEDLRRDLHVALNFPGRRLLADAAVAGRMCRVLAMANLQGGLEKWFFDAAGGQLVRIEELVLPARTVSATTDFSDFRRVDGMLMPFLERRTENAATMVARRQSVVVDPPIDRVMFSPPEAELRDAQLVEQLLTRNLESLGDLTSLMRLRSRVTKATVNVLSSGLTYRISTFQKQPNLLLYEQEIPGIGRMAQGYDGTTGWAASELQGYRTLKGAELQQLIASSDLRAEAQLRWRYPLWRLLDKCEINGRTAWGVAMAAAQGPAGSYYFDVKNGHLLRVESNISAGSEGSLAATIDFSDFRLVDGISVPFVTTLTNPAMQSVTAIESVRFNVPLDDAIFKPRKND